MKKAPTFHRRLRRRLNFSQNFRKPRAFGAWTPLLGAFGPQKWEYPPPPSRKKIWETTRKNRPEQGFHSGARNPKPVPRIFGGLEAHLWKKCYQNAMKFIFWIDLLLKNVF